MEVKQTTVIVLFLSQVMVCSIFLVICTLLIGGLLYWSEGWTYFECVYYCFVGELRHFDAPPVGQLYLISYLQVSFILPMLNCCGTMRAVWAYVFSRRFRPIFL